MKARYLLAAGLLSALLLPAGAAYDPPGRGGAATMLAEWITRGAGDLDSFELLSALDNLGVSHGESAAIKLFSRPLLPTRPISNSSSNGEWTGRVVLISTAWRPDLCAGSWSITR